MWTVLFIVWPPVISRLIVGLILWEKKSYMQAYLFSNWCPVADWPPSAVFGRFEADMVH